MPGDIEVLAVQYPGRQDRGAEPCVRNIPDLADAIHAALRPRLTEPYAFFGHSMGAILAFEVACRIARAGGIAPAHLFVSGRRAPSLVRREELHRASTAEFIAEMRALGGTDPRVFADPELLKLVLPTVRADRAPVVRHHRAGRRPRPEGRCRRRDGLDAAHARPLQTADIPRRPLLPQRVPGRSVRRDLVDAFAACRGTRSARRRHDDAGAFPELMSRQAHVTPSVFRLIPLAAP
jgi:pimeloyl-ACP methyl ester carboxylesterase